MNIRRSIIGAVLAGASLVGVASMASSAHAAEASPPLDGWEASMTADSKVVPKASDVSTRRFWIENKSTRAIVFDDAWSPHQVCNLGQKNCSTEYKHWPLGYGNSLPDHGTVIQPGDNITVEIVAWADATVRLDFVSIADKDTHRDLPRDEFRVDLYVEGWTRYSSVPKWSSSFRVEAGGQNITVYDK